MSVLSLYNKKILDIADNNIVATVNTINIMVTLGMMLISKTLA